LQPVMYPAGVACTVVAPVTNEQLRGHILSPSLMVAIRQPLYHTATSQR
jgi:hypothetical protein